MARHQLLRLGGWAALGLAVLAGCQHTPNRVPDSTSATEPNVQLKPAQVADVQVAMARTLEARGEVAEAAATYAEALKHDPNRADACVRLAILSAQQGQVAESTEFYNRALKLQPENPDIYCNFGYTLYLQHRWPEAEQALRQCLTLSPEHQRAHNNLGMLLARTGTDAAAMQEFRQAGCSEADARVNLAYALSLNGDWQQARRGYEEALALQPSCDVARKGLADLTTVAAKMLTAE
jgi:Tfp pilus assembly protein PilF